MALTTTERTKLWRGMMRIASRLPNDIPTGNIVKDDLYDPGADTGAIADLDDYLDAQAAAINNSLNANFRTGATQEFKTLLMCAVAAMRMGEDYARLVLGNLD